MATKKKKDGEETIEEEIEKEAKEEIEELEKITEPKEETKEEISEPEKINNISHFNLNYELKANGTVKKAKEKNKELYIVKKIEGDKIFAVNEKGKYIMLRKNGQYINIKFGDTISQ